MTPPRLIRLRYAAVCAGCAVDLAPSTRAWWDPTAKLVRCEGCGSGLDVDAPADAPTPDDPPPVEALPPIRSGTPGASAAREYERRLAKYEAHQADMKARHPILGRIVAATESEPQTTTAWAKGALGEQGFGIKLNALDSQGVIALHDRRIPGSRANIDHIAVASSGVWVIDVKKYSGQVECRTKGLFPPRNRLYIGRRDCTHLAEAMAKQIAPVRHILLSTSVPIHAALSIQADWPLLTRAFMVDGVVVGRGKTIRKRIASGGPLDADDVDRIARLLDARLPLA